MPNFSKSIGLIHELRKLATAKEFFHGSYNWTYIDKRIRCSLSWLLNAHALFDHALHSQQTNPKLCLDQFADTTYTAISQMIDIIFAPTTVI